LGKISIFELDAEARLAEQHAEAKEEQQRGQAHPGPDPGGDDGSDHHDGASQKDRVDVDHGHILPE
jgi:hypothetical protein